MDTRFQVMDQAEAYTLEANSASHTPKSLSDASTISSNINNNPYPITNAQTPFNRKSILSTTSSVTTNTPFKMETLHEKSNDLDGTIISQMDKTNSSKRKRKLLSPSNSFISIKRRRDLCYSDSTKRKFTQILRTPIQYFANRRRTISDLTDHHQDVNESVISSSGLFDVETVENLHDLMPSNIKHVNTKKIRKSLFTRTFSASKFGKSTRSRKGLNITKLSFDDSEIDGNERLNVSCFPEISSQSSSNSDICETRLCSNGKQEFGQPLTHAVVLTSFHSYT